MTTRRPRATSTATPAAATAATTAIKPDQPEATPAKPQVDVPASRAMPRPAKLPAPKRVNLALQGGGAHGAFGWGVMDRFIEDGRLDIEGISGASAGAMNAVVYAHGKMLGRDAARQALHDFWKAVSDAGQRMVIKPMLWEQFLGWNIEQAMLKQSVKFLGSHFSPYELNPLNINPLRDILAQQIDFKKLERESKTKLFLNTTHVATGKPKVFLTHEITLDVVMASACLPHVFQAVEIDGEFYWDGGYMGNPSLYPLFYHTDSCDVIILHIVPLTREELPTNLAEIDNRINEITFNCALIREMRAICYIQKLINDGWIKDEHVDKLKYVFIHSVRADQAMRDLSLETKMESDWKFLLMLRDRGRACADAWLEQNFEHIGKRSSVDMIKEFL
jgi:NTE family protein